MGKNIGIIGSGNVGGTLGKRWAKNGNHVVFGSREPNGDKIKKLLGEAGPNASAAPDGDLAAKNDILLLATPWDAAQEALGKAGDLKGKVLIDAVNPLLPDLSGLAIGNTDSASEQIARWATGARVVKAFNTVGANIMENPSFAGGRPVMFFCGDNKNAKDEVKPLIEELGFEAVDAGPLSQARVLEPFAMLWISLAMKFGQGRDIAFEYLRR